jgi:hypothetical protein
MASRPKTNHGAPMEVSNPEDIVVAQVDEVSVYYNQ